MSTPADQLAKLQAETDATRQLLSKIAGITITHGVQPELWVELLAEARTDLVDLVTGIAVDSELGGLTASNAQLRIVQQTLRIELLEHFNFELNNTLTEGN